MKVQRYLNEKKFEVKRNNENRWKVLKYNELVIGDLVKLYRSQSIGDYRNQYPFSALILEGQLKVDEGYVNGENYVN